MGEWKWMEGGVTAPRGFRAAGVAAGIKAGRPDVAVVASDGPASAAGVFTVNRVQAAPVRLSRQRVAAGRAQAIVVNSGCANACTGGEGAEDAMAMAALAADALGIPEESVLVCSTGTIGTRLPMDKIETGIRASVAALSPSGGPDAARAILTTDTVEKQAALSLFLGGVEIRIGAMAKGAGMIDPNMATLLVFLTTDAAVEPRALQSGLKAAADATFNRLSVDGDQSTNDTMLALANGAAGGDTLNDAHPEWPAFQDALVRVADRLADAVAADGEGATRVVTVRVRGARSEADARLAARAVARSLLVKTSWYGCDPNWGRVVAAVGYSGAEVDPDALSVWYEKVCAVQNGRAVPGLDLGEVERVIRAKRFALTVDLRLGAGAYTMRTCDCSEEYVRINSAYLT